MRNLKTAASTALRHTRGHHPAPAPHPSPSVSAFHLAGFTHHFTGAEMYHVLVGLFIAVIVMAFLACVVVPLLRGPRRS